MAEDDKLGATELVERLEDDEDVLVNELVLDVLELVDEESVDDELELVDEKSVDDELELVNEGRVDDELETVARVDVNDVELLLVDEREVLLDEVVLRVELLVVRSVGVL